MHLSWDTPVNAAIRRGPQPSCLAAAIPEVSATLVTSSSAARNAVTRCSRTAGARPASSSQNHST